LNRRENREFFSPIFPKTRRRKILRNLNAIAAFRRLVKKGEIRTKPFYIPKKYFRPPKYYTPLWLIRKTIAEEKPISLSLENYVKKLFLFCLRTKKKRTRPLSINLQDFYKKGETNYSLEVDYDLFARWVKFRGIPKIFSWLLTQELGFFKYYYFIKTKSQRRRLKIFKKFFRKYLKTVKRKKNRWKQIKRKSRRRYLRRRRLYRLKFLKKKFVNRFKSTKDIWKGFSLRNLYPPLDRLLMNYVTTVYSLSESYDSGLILRNDLDFSRISKVFLKDDCAVGEKLNQEILCLFVKKKKNNIYMTITNNKGEVKFSISSGRLLKKGRRSKKFRASYQIIDEMVAYIAKWVKKEGIYLIDKFCIPFGFARFKVKNIYYSFRRLGVILGKIVFLRKVTHGAPEKLKKARRL
jgi:hypothetical protein